jgi:hypothetical protein
MLALTQALLFWGLGEWNYAMTGLGKGAFSLLYLRWGVIPILPFLVVLVLVFSSTEIFSIHLAALLAVNIGYFFVLWRFSLRKPSLGD